MNTWKSLQTQLNQVAGQAAASVQSVDLSSTSSKLTKQFQTLTQTVKERTGNASDVTELPQEYLDLEHQVDALRAAHASLARVARVYESEDYDYPHKLEENITENIQHLKQWAEGTGAAAPTPARSLPHALSRAAASGAEGLGSGPLAEGLTHYAAAQQRVGDARLTLVNTASTAFLQPWSATLNTSLAAALKSRQSVKTARLQLDAVRATYSPNASEARKEQLQLEIEAAEEKLVSATENAILLMKSVLEDPTPLQNLLNLAKAEQAYHAAASDALQAVLSDLEEGAAAAEESYRKSRV